MFTTQSPLLPGTGVCDVEMINTGYLSPSRLCDWIRTDNTTDLLMPVLAFKIRHGDDLVLWVRLRYRLV
jgi:hypothetical protein